MERTQFNSITASHARHNMAVSYQLQYDSQPSEDEEAAKRYSMCETTCLLCSAQRFKRTDELDVALCKHLPSNMHRPPWKGRPWKPACRYKRRPPVPNSMDVCDLMRWFGSADTTCRGC